ncbi:hypothetical protein [Clostridium sp.]|uniref:hypothetical protein n=1 Tax=Clostridium sp. TaxID=1506 RepID=UPI003D6D1EAD
MGDDYNVYCFNHIANTEKVINNQIEDLKTDISCLSFEMENMSQGPNGLYSTDGRVAELTYQINKLKSQLDRLTKEEQN